MEEREVGGGSEWDRGRKWSTLNTNSRKILELMYIQLVKMPLAIIKTYEV